MRTLLEFMRDWEPLWLFVVLITETLSGYLSVMLLAKRLSERKTPARRKKVEEFESLTSGEGK